MGTSSRFFGYRLRHSKSELMEHYTPGGVRYEVPEPPQDMFSMAAGEDPLHGATLARVIQRMEYLIQEKEGELRQSWDRYHYLTDENNALLRRINAAEEKIDELYQQIPKDEEVRADGGGA